jgi:hypothetical protein
MYRWKYETHTNIYVGNINDQRHQKDPENKRNILCARLVALLDV